MIAMTTRSSISVKPRAPGVIAVEVHDGQLLTFAAEGRRWMWKNCIYPEVFRRLSRRTAEPFLEVFLGLGLGLRGKVRHPLRLSTQGRIGSGRPPRTQRAIFQNSWRSFDRGHSGGSSFGVREICPRVARATRGCRRVGPSQQRDQPVIGYSYGGPTAREQPRRWASTRAIARFGRAGPARIESVSRHQGAWRGRSSRLPHFCP